MPILWVFGNTSTQDPYCYNLDEKEKIILLETVENITIIIEDNEFNLTLWVGFIGVLEGDITVFNATSSILGGITNIDFYETFNGVFVCGFKINGSWYRQTNSKYWLYYVNGVLAPVSCSKYELQSNDTVRWAFTPYSSFQTPDNQNLEFDMAVFLALISFTIIGLIAVGLILRKREFKKILEKSLQIMPYLSFKLSKKPNLKF